MSKIFFNSQEQFIQKEKGLYNFLLILGVTAVKVYVKEVVQLNLKNVKIKSALI